MNILLTFFITFLSFLAISQPINDYENQKIVGINKEKYHANVVPYTDSDAALNGDIKNSIFYKSLNGIWKFNPVVAVCFSTADIRIRRIMTAMA